MRRYKAEVKRGAQPDPTALFSARQNC